MAFEGIIPAVTTPFTADDQVDVAGAEGEHREADRGRRARLRRHRHDGRGRLPHAPRSARSVVAAVVEAAAGRVPVIVGVSSGSARAVARLRRRRQGRGRQRGHVPAAARLPRRPGRGRRLLRRASPTCGLPVMAYNNPEASGVDMPGRADRAHLRGGRGRRRDQGVLGRHAPDPRAAAPRRRPRGARRRRRLGARGLRRGRDRLDHRRRRARAGARPSSSTTRSRRTTWRAAREVYRRMLPVARFDMTPKLVQYFKAAQDAVGFHGGPTRAPRLPLNAAERAALRRRRWRSCASRPRREGRPLLRGGRLPHGGDADARHHRRRRPDPRAPRCSSASCTSRRSWTSCGCC